MRQWSSRYFKNLEAHVSQILVGLGLEPLLSMVNPMASRFETR